MNERSVLKDPSDWSFLASDWWMIHSNESIIRSQIRSNGWIHQNGSFIWRNSLNKLLLFSRLIIARQNDMSKTSSIKKDKLIWCLVLQYSNLYFPTKITTLLMRICRFRCLSVTSLMKSLYLTLYGIIWVINPLYLTLEHYMDNKFSLFNFGELYG